MAKQIQRTVIITVVETWTLTWAGQDGQAEGAALDGAPAYHDPANVFCQHRTPVAQTVILSSSSVTTVLSRPSAGG